ncbi:MAG TPA: sorbosone dehydrogenase family protein [Azospirillum sp.]|nr:sorbosone dehydrogenase family protein [Azospirillum sp.]
MRATARLTLATAACALLVSAASGALTVPAQAQTPSSALPGMGTEPALPAPDTSHQAKNYSRQIGWPDSKTPKAPAGFTVTRYAGDLDYPRWMHALPNGDVLVAEARTLPKPPKDEAEREKAELQARSGSTGPSANRITLLRDADGDGRVEERFVLLDGLKQPFGMLALSGALYVANTDGVMRFPFAVGQTRITAKGETILNLPTGGYNNHWTRNIIANRDGSKLYVSVGSASNNGEYGLAEETRRANILEINPDGSGERVYAAGLRNPNGMDWEPVTGALWTVVNERDNIGDDLVPDYMTAVKEGGFYGWPFAYFGPNEDPRMKGQRPDLVRNTLAPDYALGPHTASLGLVFYTASSFPERYRGGVFIGQHGSWNRAEFSGYKVVHVPFANGRPSGPPEDFLTGFMADGNKGETHGRPVGVAMDATGALLVADDAGDTIWRVAPSR